MMAPRRDVPSLQLLFSGSKAGARIPAALSGQFLGMGCFSEPYQMCDMCIEEVE